MNAWITGLSVLALLGFAIFFWRVASKAGGDSVKKAIGERDHEAAARIAEGHQTFPSDIDALLNDVSDGKRGL